MTLWHLMIRVFTPFLSVLTYGPYISGTISTRTSTSSHRIMIVSMSLILSTRVLINPFVISIVATSLCSCASIAQDSTTASVATVGDLASALLMKSLFLFPPFTARTLILTSLFSLRNICDSITLAFSLIDSSWRCRGSKVSRRWSCLISYFIAFLPLFPQVFNTTLRDSCVMIDHRTGGCSSTAKLNSRCASGCSVPWLSSWAITLSYVFLVMEVTYSSLNCTFDFVDLRTPVLWFGSSEVVLTLDVSFWSKIGSSWNYLTMFFFSCWSEISSNRDYIVNSWFKYASKRSSSSVGCAANSSSTTSCSSRSSSYSIKMFGVTFWSPSTPVISDSPICQPFPLVKIKFSGWSFPRTLTWLITFCSM